MIMGHRKKIPIRRTNPKTVIDYHKHKEDLREDFNFRCGYCDDHDYFRLTEYQIDHFVPRTQLVNIKLADYFNLVYACRSCNRAKWNKWPTGNERISNNGKEGFIDPCDAEYDKQFSRNKRGEIVPETPLGRWMWIALNLGNPVHSVIWKLEQTRMIIDELLKIADTDKTDPLFNKKLNSYFRRFITYLDQLRGGAPIF